VRFCVGDYSFGLQYADMFPHTGREPLDRDAANLNGGRYDEAAAPRRFDRVILLLIKVGILKS
jgi:hypothetical protein